MNYWVIYSVGILLGFVTDLEAERWGEADTLL